MKRNWEQVFLDILFICLLVYGAYRYVYAVNTRGLVIWFSLLLFPYLAYEHYKLYQNQKRLY
jgi:uncharacterized membrane protein